MLKPAIRGKFSITGFAPPMRGKSQTCRDCALLFSGSRMLEVRIFRQVKDLPRIGLAKPLFKQSGFSQDHWRGSLYDRVCPEGQQVWCFAIKPEGRRPLIQTESQLGSNFV
jgi:hypothetical protein